MGKVKLNKIRYSKFLKIKKMNRKLKKIEYGKRRGDKDIKKYEKIITENERHGNFM